MGVTRPALDRTVKEWRVIMPRNDQPVFVVKGNDTNKIYSSPSQKCRYQSSTLY